MLRLNGKWQLQGRSKSFELRGNRMGKDCEFKHRHKRFGFLLSALEKRSDPNSHLRRLEGSNNRLIPDISEVELSIARLSVRKNR